MKKDKFDYEFDKEVLDEQKQIPAKYAINAFIQDYSEPEEENRGLMAYFDKFANILCFADIHPAAAFLKKQLHQKTFLQRCKP